MTYKDNGQPQNYYFVVDDVSESGHPTVVFTPVLYWKQEQCQSDWELNISIPWLSELMESTYEILWNVPGGPKTPQEAHDLLVAAGYVYSPAFAKAAGIYGNGSVVTKATKSKPAKLSTDFLKNYITTTLANDSHFNEILTDYRVEPEFSSLRRPKKWKRVFKKQGTIQELADTDGSVPGDIYTQLNELVYGGTFYPPNSKEFDSVYMNNFSNKVVVREFVWIDCPDQDTSISFVTDETDTRIVAICYHID